MLSPIFTLFMYFPFRAYTTVLAMLLIGWYTYRQVRYAAKNGKMSVKSGIQWWLLLNYIVLLLFFTVLGRRSLDYYRYNFDVGYSYREVFLAGDSTLALQIVANIVLFIPVGALESLVAKRWRFLKGLLLGIGLSLCIEILQLLLRCGTVEIDDLISNSLGTLIGCAIAGIIATIAEHHRKST